MVGFQIFHVSRASSTFIIACFMTLVASAALGIRNLSKSVMVSPFSSSFEPYLNVISSGWRFLDVILTILPSALRAWIHAIPLRSGTSRRTYRCESVTSRWLQKQCQIISLKYRFTCGSKSYTLTVKTPFWLVSRVADTWF